MKRSGPPKRRRTIRPSLTPIGANAARQAKRRRAQQRKHQAFRASPVYAAVRARSGGQCEYHALPGLFPARYESVVEARATRGRCGRAATDEHHMGYQGYGGDEDPSRVLDVCAECHGFIEATFYPHRRSDRRASLTRKER